MSVIDILWRWKDNEYLTFAQVALSFLDSDCQCLTLTLTPGVGIRVTVRVRVRVRVRIRVRVRVKVRVKDRVRLRVRVRVRCAGSLYQLYDVGLSTEVLRLVVGIGLG
jgi:hypothetical protein